MDEKKPEQEIKEITAEKPDNAEPGSGEKKKNSELMDWIKDLSCAVLIAAIILFFFMPTIVREESMENTLIAKDYLFVSRQEYRLLGKDIQKGDIIVFKSNLDYKGGKKLLVKRVIAVGGDMIEIRDGFVYVNDEALEEAYTKDGYTNGEMEKTLVPSGFLFCMGDNRLVSMDSRNSRIGLVSEDTVCGKVVFRIFPISKIGSVYK